MSPPAKRSYTDTQEKDLMLAVSDYRQSLLFQNLNNEKRNIQLEVHKYQKSPYLMSGCKVVDGVGNMLVTGVGLQRVLDTFQRPISDTLTGALVCKEYLTLSIDQTLEEILLVSVTPKSFGLQRVLSCRKSKHVKGLRLLLMYVQNGVEKP